MCLLRAATVDIVMFMHDPDRVALPRTVDTHSGIAEQLDAVTLAPHGRRQAPTRIARNRTARFPVTGLLQMPCRYEPVCLITALRSAAPAVHCDIEAVPAAPHRADDARA